MNTTGNKKVWVKQICVKSFIQEVFRTKLRSLQQSAMLRLTSAGHLYEPDNSGVVCQRNDRAGGVGEGAVMCTEGKQNTPLWAAVLRVMVAGVSHLLWSRPHLLWVDQGLKCVISFFK